MGCTWTSRWLRVEEVWAPATLATGAPRILYWYRSASIGSSLEARRAG